MQLGIIGLGRMGANMARRLIKRSHECAVFDVSSKAAANTWGPREVERVTPMKGWSNPTSHEASGGTSEAAA